MKYDIQFTNQFKKDLKLAKKQNKSIFWRMAVRWKQNTETTILQVTIKARVSVILNQTGYSFMRFKTMF